MYINDFAISPNGTYLANGTEEGHIYIWDAHSGDLLQSLPGHYDDITHLYWTEDSKSLVSTSKDGTIRLWGVP